MNWLSSRGYTSFTKLDSGGQANVYKTVKSGKDFAIKVVRVENRAPDKLEDDLKRELQIARNLKHPNCIHVEDLFRTQGKFYIIMDFMPNGNIGDVIRTKGPVCEWNAKLWFCPVARAVNYLHDHKVAHRDLKLDNVLLDAYLNPIITDYGFSRFVRYEKGGEVMMSKTYCGTVSHNPPEMLKRLPYDPFKSDIWCCGIMLFIMINQVYPFDRRDDQMHDKQIRREYKLQKKVEARISNELKHLIHILLEPEQAKRPSIQKVCEHGWFPIIHQEYKLGEKTVRND